MTTTGTDPIDVLAALWLSVVAQCEAHDGHSEEAGWLGMAAGLQLAIAAVSGLPTGTVMLGSDAIRAGGDIARARATARLDGCWPW